MTILPQLERDLYNAARERLPGAGQGDPAPPPSAARRGRLIRERLGNVLVAASFVVVLAVAGTVLVLTGTHTRRPRATTSSRFEVNSAPTLAQLLAHFAVLRRPQTAADRAVRGLVWLHGRQGPVTILPRYNRLATALADGGRVFVTVGKVGGPYAGQQAGSYLLSAWVLSPNGGSASVSRPSYISSSGYDWLPAPIVDSKGTILLSIVPDGVRAVAWLFPGSSILASVDGNVAAGELREAPPAVPEKVYWYGHRGQVLKVFTVGPPKRVLSGNGVAGARFGEGIHAVVARLSRLLGPPMSSLLPSACGPVDTIGWRDLLAFFRGGRFIGYAYGSQSPEAVPGPLLATMRGLTLGDTMAQGSRVYGAAFRTSEEQGGTWFLSTPSGELDGFTYSRIPPKHGDIGPQSTITSVQAGPSICAALSP